MIEVTSLVRIEENEIQLDFIRASGPGGQNVNKVSTACQLRWNLASTTALAPEVKERLIKLAGSRVTEDGVLMIEAKRYRTQDQNRIDALARLVTLIQQALVPPKVRRKTRPSIAAREKRMEQKRRRSLIKNLRNIPPKEHE